MQRYKSGYSWHWNQCWMMCLNSEMSSELHFLAPRPRRLRKTGCPGTELEFAFFAPSSLASHEVHLSSIFSFKRCLMPRFHFKKCSQTCPIHKLLLVGQTRGKSIHLFRSQDRQTTWSEVLTVFEHPRKLYVLLLLLNVWTIETFSHALGRLSSQKWELN